MTYVTAGTGHRRAAEAVAQAAAARWPDARVECVDALTYAPGWFQRGYGLTYLFLVQYCSWIWRFTYACSDFGPAYQCMQPLRRWWNLIIARRFVHWLRTQPPDLIVATHFLPADVCAAGRRDGWLRAPVVVVVTDIYPHRFWLAKDADMTAVATATSQQICEMRGLSRERLRVVGIPIGSAFSQPVDRSAVQRRLGCSPQRSTVLVGSGGTTVGRFEAVVEALIGLEHVLPGQLQLLVVCGEDEGTRRRLSGRARTSPMPLHAFGFIENMAELMGVSDLIISKAGGLMVMEALGRGVPLILYHVIPGQERLNACYVEDAGAGRIAHGPRDVARCVRALMEDPARLQATREAAARLARPDAAQRLVAEVLEPLLRSSSASSS